MFEGDNPLIQAAADIHIDKDEAEELGIGSDDVTGPPKPIAPKLGSYERLMAGFGGAMQRG